MVFSNGKHMIIPVNPELIMLAQKNLKFREVVNRASLVLPDGIGVVLASRFGSHRITERVTGVDTTHRIAEMARRSNLRVFLLGAAPGVAARAAVKLQEKHLGLEIAGTYAGSPHPNEEERICDIVNAAHPHVLLVAYGAPKQELWLARNINKLNVPVAMCVGGTFDFIAGTASRAPRAIQALGIEWLFRLFQQPSRWKRMLALPLFAIAVVRRRQTTLNTNNS